MNSPPSPTIEELNKAHERFEQNEPRDLLYRAATELVNLAIHGTTSLSLAEAIAVFLQTWNRMYYRFRPFDDQHFSEIEQLLTSHSEILAAFRKRSIEGYRDEDQLIVRSVFNSFEDVLGPVGAAKALHLLAPRFFPLWDRQIAKVYGLPLNGKGRNGERYCRFVSIVQEQIARLGRERALGRNPLKALDENNYCRYTKGWL